jgi:hypothetical protein
MPSPADEALPTRFECAIRLGSFFKPKWPMASGAAASIRARFLMLFMSHIGRCSPCMRLVVYGKALHGAKVALRKPQALSITVALLIANYLACAFLPNGDRRQGKALLAVTKPPGTLR